jgi:hypothetical protein
MAQNETTSTKSPIFSVYIVESPSATDFYYQQTIGQGLTHFLNLAGIPYFHTIAISPGFFKYSLQHEIYNYLKYPQTRFPILHIIAHGSAKGLQMSNGEMIFWSDLRKSVNPINKKLNGFLIICIASCEGINGYEMAKTTDEKDVPFYGLVGHCGKPSIADATIAFNAFYHVLLKTDYDFNKAVQGMQFAAYDRNFISVRGEIIQKEYSDEIRREALENLAQEIRQTNGTTFRKIK